MQRHPGDMRCRTALNAKDTPQLKAKPIFEELQNAGITLEGLH